MRRYADAACAALAVALVAAPLRAAQDTTADAALGQPDLLTIGANNPGGSPTASNLALLLASHVALAPSGRLYVSDAGNNRVLGYSGAAALASGAAADMVIGQPDFISGQPAAVADAANLNLPQGLFVDGAGNLWVCDAFNHRVLRYDDPETHDGVADQVFGQPDFSSNEANLGGGFVDQHVATADGLCFPGRVFVRWPDVWIADSGNSRVLHYSAPIGNKPASDRVFGQYDDFSSRAKNNDGAGEDGCCATAGNLFNPIGIALDAAGDLLIADWQNSRVLRYDAPLATDTVADAVLGQSDFTGATPNALGPYGGLNFPIDLVVDARNRLIIADATNHRVLAYRNGGASGLPAIVFGQLGSFDATSPNHGLGPFAADADGLSGPSGLAIDVRGNLFVADVDNSRVLRFDGSWLRVWGGVPTDAHRIVRD